MNVRMKNGATIYVKCIYTYILKVGSLFSPLTACAASSGLLFPSNVKRVPMKVGMKRGAKIYIYIHMCIHMLAKG